MNEITVNGKKHEIFDLENELTLMEYLRNKLDLTGTKNGCNIGVCGACTVLVNGEAKKACVIKLPKVIGKEILTIEGMESPEGSLHPIQQAFMDYGAIQCGYCTPGMVMKSYALLLQDKEPSREKIKKALAGNLCRCTGYQQIIDAVEAASKIMRE